MCAYHIFQGMKYLYIHYGHAEDVLYPSDRKGEFDSELTPSVLTID